MKKDSPAQAVVAFQKSYFAGDADALEGTLAKSSPLRATDWNDVLDEMDGSNDSWCVSIDSVDGETVEAVTTGKDQGEAFTWDQKIETTKGHNGYVVNSIDNRS